MDKQEKHILEQIVQLNESFISRMQNYSEADYEQYFSQRNDLFVKLGQSDNEERSTSNPSVAVQSLSSFSNQAEPTNHPQTNVSLTALIQQIKEQDQTILRQLQTLREQASKKLEQLHKTRKQRKVYNDPYRSKLSNSVFFDQKK